MGHAQNVQLIPLNGGTDQESNTFSFDSFGRSISTMQRIQNERSYIMQAKFDKYEECACECYRFFVLGRVCWRHFSLRFIYAVKVERKIYAGANTDFNCGGTKFGDH